MKLTQDKLIEQLRKSLAFLICAAETEPEMSIYIAQIEQAKAVLQLVEVNHETNNVH
jgi:hypothetical protein